MNLYLIRHGETEFNLRSVYYGWTDCDINEKGIEQAVGLHSFFQRVKYDRIIASDLKRAMHTAVIVKGEKEVPLTADASLREVNFGDWEDRSFEEIEKNDPENCHAWWKDWKNARIPGGETFMEFYARVSGGIQNIIEQYSAEDVVVVSHSGAIACMLCHLLGAGPEGFWKIRSYQGAYHQISVTQGNIVLEKVNAPARDK